MIRVLMNTISNGMFIDLISFVALGVWEIVDYKDQFQIWAGFRTWVICELFEN